MTLIIRELREEDLDSCSELYSQVFSDPPWSEKWSKEKANERLIHFYKSDGFIGLIAEKGYVKGFVLGNAEPFLDGNWFYLREMCISKLSQRQGIGTGLIKQLSVTLVDKKVSKIYLATDRNIPAAKFYEKNGFSLEENMGFYCKGV